MILVVVGKYTPIIYNFMLSLNIILATALYKEHEKLHSFNDIISICISVFLMYIAMPSIQMCHGNAALTIYSIYIK